MPEIRRILFPIDFSPECRVLAPTVRRMIDCWNAEVVLLHVTIPRDSLGRDYDLQRLFVERSAIAGKQFPSARLHCRLEEGDAARRIVEYAGAHAIDLIVLPAGGSDHSYGQPIGRVADQVLSEAPCPVWLDWGSARSRATAGMYARHVSCVLGMDDCDEHILCEASDLTVDLDAELTVIHAVPSAPKLGLVRRRIEQLRKRLSPEAEVAIRVGTMQDVVARAVREQECGLLVTGNCRETILAAEAECPVLRLVTPIAAAAYTSVRLPELAACLRKSA